MLKISKERRLARKIKILLNKRGFIVDIRSAKNSKSVYLRLDNGACTGIRISDHNKPTNNKTNYRFNVIKGYQGIRSKFVGGQLNQYYNFHSIARLISNIETERSNKIIKYGYANYRKIRDRQISYNSINYIKNVA